jgi:hypothetical membrane protein
MFDDGKVAGALLFIAGVQCVMGIIIAEALYPGYSTSQNYISDLGVGPSALIFNSSVFLLGLIAVVGVYFFQRALGSRLLSLLLAITGFGAMGVGLLPENFGILHAIPSLITFLFGGLSAIVSYRIQKPPLSYFSILLGALSLAALVLFGSSNYLGLGKGGMERMIAYPTLLWAVGFGGHLMSHSGEKTAKS